MRSLGPTEPGIRLAFGVSGSGKTYGMRRSVWRSVRAGVPVIVIDTLREIDALPADLAPVSAGTYSIADACERLAQGARLVIVVSPDEDDARAIDPQRQLADACAWARRHPGPAGVAMPEIHLAIPNTTAALPRALDTAIYRYRHHKILLWGDSQRPASVRHGARDQARETRYYALSEDDAAELRHRELAAAIRECSARYARGEYGWHVPVYHAHLPPFELCREDEE